MENYVGRIVKFSLFIDNYLQLFIQFFPPFNCFRLKLFEETFVSFSIKQLPSNYPAERNLNIKFNPTFVVHFPSTIFSGKKFQKSSRNIYIVYRETCHVHKIVLFIYSRVFETINSVFIRKEGNLAFILIIEEFKKQEQG